MSDVTITDVYLRDGLQDEDVVVPTADKLRVVDALLTAGVRGIEVASFVNPARVPQMADAAAVYAGLPVRDDVTYRCLALNGRGVGRAVEAGADVVQLVTSASEAHSSANAGRSIAEAVTELCGQVTAHPSTTFVAGISTAFVCPFEGEIDPARLIEVATAFVEAGVTEIGLADTLGTAPPDQVASSLSALVDAVPRARFSLHLHDARGQALDTVLAAIDTGVTQFDAALAGYGGCPFAPGAHGNLATETLVHHLRAHGHDTGIDGAAIDAAARLARDTVAAAPALTATSS